MKATDSQEVTNKYIAGKLNEVAKLRESRNETFPAKAYRKAAGLVLKHPTPIKSYEDATKIKGIGKGKIALAIDEILKTHKLECLENKSEKDKTLELFESIWGFGPAISHKLYEKEYRTIDDLREAVGGIRDEILTLTDAQLVGLEHFEDFNLKMNCKQAEDILAIILKQIPSELPVKCEITGSYRRLTPETKSSFESKDVDVLIYPTEPIDVSKICYSVRDNLKKNYPTVKILGCGEVQLFIALEVDEIWRRVDIFTSKFEEFACSMLAHTGSSSYNVQLRDLATRRGWLLNEKGLFNEKNERIPTATESDVQRALGVELLEPSKR